MQKSISRHAFPATTSTTADPMTNAAQGEDLDLHGIVAVLRAHWLSVVVVMALTLLLGLLLAMLKQPEYVSTGVISVGETPSVATKGKAPRADPRAGGRDVALLRSRRLAVHVIQALEPERLGTASQSGEMAAISPGRISHFLNRLKVSQPPGSPVIEIRYRSDDPREAARVVNQVIESFRQAKAEQVGELFASEKRYVDAELKKRRDELLAVEQRMSDFRNANGLVEGAGPAAKGRQIGTLNGQLVLARVEAEKAEARWRQIDALIRAGDMAAVGAAVDSP